MDIEEYQEGCTSWSWPEPQGDCENVDRLQWTDSEIMSIPPSEISTEIITLLADLPQKSEDPSTQMVIEVIKKFTQAPESAESWSL